MTQFVIRMLAVITLLSVGVHGEVLFGPVVVENGSHYSGTFGMYCRCAAYFIEAQNGEGEQSTAGCTVVLNGETVLDLEKGWSSASRQVELRETEPNEIEIEVKVPTRGAATVEVYERDVTPAPMAARQYTKKRRTIEFFSEGFVLNHWATRFRLRILNGEENGGNRVKGRVLINGVEVVGYDELNEHEYRVVKEIELIDGWNEVEVYLDGRRDSYVNIGMEEAAQTVEVTEVAEVPIDGVPGGVIGMHGDQVYVKMGIGGGRVRQVDGNGDVQTMFTEGDEREHATGMSRRGDYVATRFWNGQEWRRRLYDWEWNEVTQWVGPPVRTEGVELISDNGNTLMEIEYDADPGEGGAPVGYHFFDGAGTPLFSFSGDVTLRFAEDLYMVSPDGESVAQFGPEELQVYWRDGKVRWSTAARFNSSLANSGQAVQATADSLLFFASDGRIERRVLNPDPDELGALSASTPDGQHAMHFGNSTIVAKRNGPQSCWRFSLPGGMIAGATMSDDGRWVWVLSTTHGPEMKSAIWLVGAGGAVAWEIWADGMVVTGLRSITEFGEYFYFTEHDPNPPGFQDHCHLFRVDLQEEGR